MRDVSINNDEPKNCMFSFPEIKPINMEYNSV